MRKRPAGYFRTMLCVVALSLQVVATTVAQAQRGQPATPAGAQDHDPCYPMASCPNIARVPSSVATPPNAAGRIYQPGPQSPPPSNGGDGHSLLGDIIKALIVAVLVYVVVDALTGEWTKPATLDSDGPRFPVKQTLGKFQAQGYALAGWPVAIDLDTLPGTTNWLEIKDKKDHSVRLPIAGEGRRVPVLRIPAVAWLDTPAVARFSIVSIYPADNGEVRYQPLQIYGIAAGPRAVGSMKIAVTRFDPNETSQPQNVRYALRADRQFDRSTVEVLRLPDKGKNDLTLARDERLLPLPAGPHDGAWATMTQRKKDRSGVYMLQARAWLVGGRNDERDWTGAFAPNFVRVP